MIQRSRILECFTGLVGWRNSGHSCYETLNADLRTSASGLYFQGLSGVTIELIVETLAKDYDGDINAYLTDVNNDAILDVVNKFMMQEKNKIYTKSILSNYDLGIRQSQTNRTQGIKNNRFVGFEIRPQKSVSVKAEVIQLGGMFKQIQNDLPIYFYSSMQLEPLEIFTADVDKAMSVCYFDLTTSYSGSGVDVEIPAVVAEYINRDNGNNARYFLGYYEEDLDANNYAILTEWPGFGGCMGCGKDQFRKNHDYVIVTPIEVNSGKTYSDRSLFDITDVGYTNATHGLFLKMNVSCDITEAMCDNKLKFANIIQKAVAVRVLNDIANSNTLTPTQTNKRQQSKELAMKYDAELNGYTAEGRYIRGELEMLALDFSNMDSICLGASKGSFGIMQL